MKILHIRQDDPTDGVYPIRLTLKRSGQADLEAEARIRFALTEQEQEDLRWYLEDYLQHSATVEVVTALQVEALIKASGEELYTQILAANQRTQALWFSIRNDLANLRVEITTGIAEAASIPWELMRDPEMDSPISLRVKSFVRVQSDPNVSFVQVPSSADGRVQLLYVACRPRGSQDVELRAVANRLLHDLGENRARFDIKALRPPTFEQLQRELTDANEAGRPYHIVHFDGHGIYADLSESNLAAWVAPSGGGDASGKHGYLLFEHASDERMRPVGGQMLGQLLHDSGVPVLVLNACQSAMHEATAAQKSSQSVHDEVRAIGSLAQTIIDQGIPAVLGMRYSVYVVTAAQYIGEVYAAMAKGRSFGQAATEGRKHLQRNPERWVGLQPRPLQDWFVPVAYEAAPIELLPASQTMTLGKQPEMDPIQNNRALLRYVPEEGFIGRDETILALDRAFDSHRVVLLHAYAGQGKSSTAVEFARWYALTGGLSEQPLVLLASFESHTDLNDLLNQIGQPFAPLLDAQGIHWGALNDADERRNIVVQILRNFPVLWVWDNVETVGGFPEGAESQWTIAEQQDLRDFLQRLELDRASKVKVLLTSRRDEAKWLGKIPHRIVMPRMRNSDAAKLALKLGEEKNLLRSEIAAWQPLLDYCAGNPLTLRVLVGQAVKMGLREHSQIVSFVEAIRGGELQIEDADEKEGRDKSLGASLDYGFRNAFKEDELPIIALLHLFQGTVNASVLVIMGLQDSALPELQGRTQENITELLERAKDTGLLTHLHATWFPIHPALPWFLRQLFYRHYDGQDGRSKGQMALRVWVNAVGAFGSFFMTEFVDGNRRVIDLLEIEEANLLHARRLARRNQWWDALIGCMQGLRALYEYQGRTAEWARLVDEIAPNYCTIEDEPIEGLEDEYELVMDYRVDISQRYERNLMQAAKLQGKRVEWSRQRAAGVLGRSEDAPLDALDRNRLQSLGVSAFRMGFICQEQNNPECVKYYEDSIGYDRQCGDTTAEAISEWNLGNAYRKVTSIRDLDAAEAAYERALDLCAPNDALGRSRCISQIGRVHHERFLEARKTGEPEATWQRHLQSAEKNYIEAVQMCALDALHDRATLHNQLGSLYGEVGYLDDARAHFEKAAKYYEKGGDRFAAGGTRYNMALLYFKATLKEDQQSKQRIHLLRARAYAEAALRDFQHYQGRAVAEETEARTLITKVDQALAKLQ
jgi:tetratricopeptide (TPR) repeat protein